MSTPINVRIPEHDRSELRKIGIKRGFYFSQIVRRAIRFYLSVHKLKRSGSFGETKLDDLFDILD